MVLYNLRLLSDLISLIWVWNWVSMCLIKEVNIGKVLFLCDNKCVYVFLV